jgi:hypothetical protein
MRPNEVEAANRAEVTALLIRAGYHVYRPEADIDGEDLVLRTPKPDGILLSVQQKARPYVDRERYGGRGLYMLFPDPEGGAGREWYLVDHDILLEYFMKHHGETQSGQKGIWYTPGISSRLREFLKPFRISLGAASAEGLLCEGYGPPPPGWRSRVATSAEDR